MKEKKMKEKWTEKKKKFRPHKNVNTVYRKRDAVMGRMQNDEK